MSKPIKIQHPAPQTRNVAQVILPIGMYCNKPLQTAKIGDVVQLQCFDLQRKHAAYLTEHADDYKVRKVAIKEQHWQWYIRAVGLALTSNKD